MDLQPGYYYHIYKRGNNSQQIFFNRDNYLFFLKRMKEYLIPFVSVISWCLMPNHFHWVVFVHQNNIVVNNGNILTSSEGINKYRTINQSIGILLRSYSRAIQKQENTTGSLFQKHTKAQPLVDEISIEPAYWNTSFGTQNNISEGKSNLETCIDYVHQNPLHSGLVRNVVDWEFSSFRDYIGLRDGELIDYDLIKKEQLLPLQSDTLTESEGVTKKNMCIIGIGSNIEAGKNIQTMLEILKKKVDVLNVSTMIKTKPIGIEYQADFTNGAVKIQTLLSLNNLNRLLKNIEDQMGRDRSAPKFGPRCIDLDIVVWNGKIVDEDYYTRDFLQKSIQEIKD